NKKQHINRPDCGQSCTRDTAKQNGKYKTKNSQRTDPSQRSPSLHHTQRALEPIGSCTVSRAAGGISCMLKPNYAPGNGVRGSHDASGFANMMQGALWFGET